MAALDKQMASFSPLERSFARLLGRFPGLRAKLKSVYQNANYLLYRDSSFTHTLHPRVEMYTPSQLIGSAEPEPDVAEFFGYFDASPWSADGRFYVVNQIASSAKVATIVIYDFLKRSRFEIGTSEAFTWQQGTMTRWLVHSGRTFVSFNSVVRGTLGTTLFCPLDGTTRFLPMPLQAVSDLHAKIYSVNYLRLGRNQTEYGYSIAATNLDPRLDDSRDGLWSTDLATGDTTLIVSLDRLKQFAPRRELDLATEHEVNHVSVAPGGDLFVFVHRFRGATGQYSRLYMARHDGQDLRLLLDEDMVSHYAWFTRNKLFAWARTRTKGDGYYFIDANGSTDLLSSDSSRAWGDGHPSYHAERGLIVTDSYPDRKRQQHLLLIDPTCGRQIEVGTFLLPTKFGGSNRIDLHPRWSPAGDWISIDSGFPGVRRNYVVNVSRIGEPSTYTASPM